MDMPYLMHLVCCVALPLLAAKEITDTLSPFYMKFPSNYSSKGVRFS